VTNGQTKNKNKKNKVMKLQGYSCTKRYLATIIQQLSVGFKDQVYRGHPHYRHYHHHQQQQQQQQQP
jgi:hypothetical protein